MLLAKSLWKHCYLFEVILTVGGATIFMVTRNQEYTRKTCIILSDVSKSVRALNIDLAKAYLSPVCLKYLENC